MEIFRCESKIGQVIFNVLQFTKPVALKKFGSLISQNINLLDIFLRNFDLRLLHYIIFVGFGNVK